MARITFVEYKGQRIMELDISRCEPEETVKSFNEAHQIIATNPPKSVLLMTIASKAVISKNAMEAVKNFAVANTPYIKGSAVVGVDSTLRIFMMTVQFMTLHPIKLFGTREEAMEYLIGT